MKVHILKPFDIDKNLGRAYNEAMAMIPDGDWGCLMDLDTMFLTPDAGNILHEYAKQFPSTGMFTCFTNRIHPLNSFQLATGEVSEDSDVKKHIDLAEFQKQYLYKATRINNLISGFLMMVKKETWNKIKFDESRKCLGVDNFYSQRILESGLDIMRMDGLYVWHTYRLKNGIKDKNHLL